MVTDPDTRALVLETFAPEGPWRIHSSLSGAAAVKFEKLADWPQEIVVADVSGDGVPEVFLHPGDRWDQVGLKDGRVTFGTAGNPHNRLRLYQWLDGEFIEVREWWRANSDLVGLSRTHPWKPATLKVANWTCCPEGWSLSHYQVVFEEDILDTRRILDILPVPPGRVEEVFDAPRPFVVENSVYSLRGSPEIGPSPDWPSRPGEWFGWSPAATGIGPWQFDGNRLALYDQGARGIALASATDDTGRVWWYVLMSPHTPPVEPVFQTPVSLGGWMSSRFLREVGRVADTPPGRDPPPELPEPR